MHDHLRVGRLGGVGVTQPSAVADDRAAQPGDAQAPATNVRRVNVVVPQLAVARIPKPVPVVMKLRTSQWNHRCRPHPEVVIDASGNFAMSGSADGIPPAIDNAPGQLHVAEFAVVNVFDGPGQRAVGTVLRSTLADAVQFARGPHDPAAFADVVADRFLDIDVLAGLHAPDGDQGVPVVGRGRGDDVDRLIVHDAAQVLFIPGGLALLVFDVFHRPADHGLVAVANGRDDAAVLGGEAADVCT